ncbi:MAG: TolC family protein [Desulfovibrio sp.]|nr:MAG: TolC family protein [Desulfovibrio sp.]
MVPSLFRPLRGPYRVNCLLVVLLVVLAGVLWGCPKQEQQLQTMRMENRDQDVAAIQAQELEVIAETEQGPQSLGTLSVDQPFSLGDAIAFALMNNLDVAMAVDDQAIQEEVATGAIFDLLPSLVLSAERSHRDNEAASSSQNYYTGEESLAASMSSEQNTARHSAELSWNLLNFAVNFMKWGQELSRIGVTEQRLRRVRQNLAYDVTQAYARVAVAQETAEQADIMIQELEARLVVLEDNVQRRLVPRSEALETEATIMETVFLLRKILKEYDSARVELNQLMGLEPDTNIIVSGFDFTILPDPMPVDLSAMQDEALLNRPELFEQDIAENISRNEAHQALIKMLPTVTPYYRYDHDDNDYLVHNDWYTVGLRISWDILSIPGYWADMRVADAQTRRVRTERAQISAAVMAQVALSVIEYQDMLEQTTQLKAVAEKRAELTETVRLEVEQGKVHRAMLLDMEERSLSAKMEYHSSYARLISAMARVANSLGRDWEAGAYQEVPGVTSGDLTSSTFDEDAARLADRAEAEHGTELAVDIQAN